MSISIMAFIAIYAMKVRIGGQPSKRNMKYNISSNDFLSTNFCHKTSQKSIVRSRHYTERPAAQLTQTT